jgi:hypothetical protein
MIDHSPGRILNEAELIAPAKVGSLPDYLLNPVALEKLWRGEPGNGDVHPDTAELIDRFSDLDYPIVLEATVLKPNVLAYFNERREQEIVVKPGRVMAVREVK